MHVDIVFFSVATEAVFRRNSLPIRRETRYWREFTIYNSQWTIGEEERATNCQFLSFTPTKLTLMPGSAPIRFHVPPTVSSTYLAGRSE
jgi:hypothetical protein